MKSRFILYRRKRGGMFYLEDTETRKQQSLGTRHRPEALALLNARNESVRQPQLNLHIARTYLAASDPAATQRTWAVPLEELANSKPATVPISPIFGKPSCPPFRRKTIYTSDPCSNIVSKKSEPSSISGAGSSVRILTA